MIDVKIELRQKGDVWEQVACLVELRNRHVPVLEIPARVDETFLTKEQAIATMKERVTLSFNKAIDTSQAATLDGGSKTHPTTPDM